MDFRSNLTDVAFKAMKLNTTECKKKFVCKTDYNAKYNVILASTLSFFKDKNYEKYKTNTTIKSLEDCNRLYINCKKINI